MPICYRLTRSEFQDGNRLLVGLTNSSVADCVCRVLMTCFGGLTVRAGQIHIRLDLVDVEQVFELSGDMPGSEEFESIFSLMSQLMSVKDRCEISHCLDMYRIPEERENSAEEWVYTPGGKRVYDAKYRSSQSAARSLLQQIVSIIDQHPALRSATAVSPMPPSSDHGSRPDLPRFWAQEISKARGVPVITIDRSRPATSQKNFPDPDQRRQNQQDSMAVKSDIGGSRVLLIDDLYMLGDSVNEAQRVLRAAGAAAVFSLCATKTAKGCQGYSF